MTEFLAERAAEVMAFEIDHRLVPILADTLRDFDNVTVVNEDILKVDLAQHIQNFKNPEHYFVKALENDPSELLYELATYLEGIGFYPQAKEIYLKIVEDFPEDDFIVESKLTEKCDELRHGLYL